MPSRIDDIFSSLRADRRKAVMPFVCAGHPVGPGGPAPLAPILHAMERGGASIVEVGVPFSDPIADGAVIAAAMHEALAAGVTPAGIFEQVRATREHTRLGLVAMVSVSIAHRLASGGEPFFSRLRSAGFDGAIIPDVPLEECGPLVKAAADNGITLSLLVSPSTSPSRAEEIVKVCTGFVYVLARAGLTGEQADAPEISKMIARLRQMTPLPLAVGFGISTPEHVREVVKHADAAIVGSAMVRRLDAAAKSGHDVPAAAEAFTRELATGLG